MSDGPAIEWVFTFLGTPEQFAEHYRRVLTTAGWAEEPADNLPGQLASFTNPRRNVVISVFGPTPDASEFSLLATPG